MQEAPVNTALIQKMRMRLQTEGVPDELAADLLAMLEIDSTLENSSEDSFQEFLKTLHHLNIELAQIKTLEDLYARAVELGAPWLGFDRLTLLLLEGDSFVGTYEMGLTGHLIDRSDMHMPALDEHSRWNRVLRSSDQVYLWDDVELEQTGQESLRGWQAIAMMKDGEVTIGALVVDNLRTHRPSRPYEAELLALYSGALGNLISRKRAEMHWQQAEQTAREFQTYLKSLHEISIELTATRELDDLYRRVIEVGLESLGFDRLGLFMFDNQKQRVVGTYVTDPEGRIRSEAEYERDWAIDGSVVERVLHSKDRVLLLEDADLSNYGEVIGHGWNAMAALWDGDQMLGYLAADNHITHYPVRPYERELLSLFGTLIGHLILHKRNNKALRDSEERFRMLLELAPVGIILVAEDGQIVTVNRQTEVMFGYSREEFATLRLEDLMPERFQDNHRTHRDPFFKAPQDVSIHMAVHREPSGRRRDGTEFPIQVVFSSFRSNSDVLGLSFIIDLTEQKKAERQQFDLRLEQERIQIMTEFIKDAAHEFRTPLSIIKSSSYLLERVTEEARRQILYENIQNEADSIVELVEGLTTTVRLDRASDAGFSDCLLNPILSAIIDRQIPRINEIRLTLELDLEESPVTVYGHPEDLKSRFHPFAG